MDPTCRLTSRIEPVGVPLAPDEQKGWKPYYLFRGLTRDETYLSCHVSVLTAGHSPHPPHTHKEEELLLVLAGEVDLTLPQLASDRQGRPWRLQTGQFVYYPAEFPHTLTSASSAPANYLMFKWHSGRKADKAHLPFRLADTAEYLSKIETIPSGSVEVMQACRKGHDSRSSCSRAASLGGRRASSFSRPRCSAGPARLSGCSGAGGRPPAGLGSRGNASG
jgi:mannose-6-phosphate isomerase-like protein (cupin superfamily)